MEELRTVALGHSIHRYPASGSRFSGHRRGARRRWATRSKLSGSLPGQSPRCLPRRTLPNPTQWTRDGCGVTMLSNMQRLREWSYPAALTPCHATSGPGQLVRVLACTLLLMMEGSPCLFVSRNISVRQDGQRVTLAVLRVEQFVVAPGPFELAVK